MFASRVALTVAPAYTVPYATPARLTDQRLAGYLDAHVADQCLNGRVTEPAHAQRHDLPVSRAGVFADDAR